MPSHSTISSSSSSCTTAVFKVPRLPQRKMTSSSGGSSGTESSAPVFKVPRGIPIRQKKTVSSETKSISVFKVPRLPKNSSKATPSTSADKGSNGSIKKDKRMCSRYIQKKAIEKFIKNFHFSKHELELPSARFTKKVQFPVHNEIQALRA
uniref:Histone domain-containing protein n=1 Tax=Caenorhabditis tropicalis TaxID=1561998 RepID=A0A1I7ULY9_9PELO